MPQISFVICAIRFKHSLSEVVKRIQIHFRPGDELILVIGSKASGVLRPDFSSQFSKVVFTEEVGCGAYRDIGVKTASKELIAFVDDDTLLLDHWRVEVERSFEISSIGFYIAQSKSSSSVMLNSKISTPFIFFSDTAGSVFRKLALDSAGGFDKGMIRSEDTDVTTRITCRGWDSAIGTITIQDSGRSSSWEKLKKTARSLRPHARICTRAGMRVEVKSFFQLHKLINKSIWPELSSLNIVLIYLIQDRPDQFLYQKFPRHTKVLINIERELFLLADGTRIIFGDQKIKFYHIQTGKEVLVETSDCEISSNKSMVTIKILKKSADDQSFAQSGLVQRSYQI